MFLLPRSAAQRRSGAGHANHLLTDSGNNNTRLCLKCPHHRWHHSGLLFPRRNTREGQGRPVERIRHFGDAQTSKNVITWDLTACTCLISSLKPHTVHCAHGKGGPKGKGRGRSVVLDRPAARVDFTLQLSQQQDITSRASAIHQSAPDGQVWRCAVTMLGITLHRVRTLTVHGEGLQLGEALRTQPSAMRLNLSRAGRMRMQFSRATCCGYSCPRIDLGMGSWPLMEIPASERVAAERGVL
jgi:hypothetical protein